MLHLKISQTRKCRVHIKQIGIGDPESENSWMNTQSWQSSFPNHKISSKYPMMATVPHNMVRMNNDRRKRRTQSDSLRGVSPANTRLVFHEITANDWLGLHNNFNDSVFTITCIFVFWLCERGKEKERANKKEQKHLPHTDTGPPRWNYKIDEISKVWSKSKCIWRVFVQDRKHPKGLVQDRKHPKVLVQDRKHPKGLVQVKRFICQRLRSEQRFSQLHETGGHKFTN